MPYYKTVEEMYDDEYDGKDEECYDESHIVDKDGNEGIALFFNECEHHATYWKHSEADLDAFDTVVSENACPFCRPDIMSALDPPPPVKPKIEREKKTTTRERVIDNPDSRIIEIVGVAIDIDRRIVDETHEGIKQVLKDELGYDDISHITDPLGILIEIAKDVWTHNAQLRFA